LANGPFPRPLRGEVWQIDFNPTIGAEIQKTRPAVVISSDAFTPLETKIVVPLTTWQEVFTTAQWMVRIDADKTNGLARASGADALQLRCVSYSRFMQRLGKISSAQTDEIAAAIAIAIDYQ